MAIPTPANYVFLPWVRQGLLAGLTNATDSGNTSPPCHIVLTVRLRIKNTRNVGPNSTVTDAVVREVFIMGVRLLISIVFVSQRTLLSCAEVYEFCAGTLHLFAASGAVAGAGTRTQGRARFRGPAGQAFARIEALPYAVVPLAEEATAPAAQAIGFADSRAVLGTLNRSGACWQAVPLFELVH